MGEMIKTGISSAGFKKNNFIEVNLHKTTLVLPQNAVLTVQFDEF